MEKIDTPRIKKGGAKNPAFAEADTVRLCCDEHFIGPFGEKVERFFRFNDAVRQSPDKPPHLRCVV